jgi:hypothetical protein
VLARCEHGEHAAARAEIENGSAWRNPLGQHLPGQDPRVAVRREDTRQAEESHLRLLAPIRPVQP